MSFREKSAWVMAMLMIGAGLYYLYVVQAASQALGVTAPPMVVFVFVAFVIIGSIVVQIVLAVSSPREANAPADERERTVEHRAGNWSGLVLGVGAVTSLGAFLYYGDGNLLFHLIMGSLIVSQVAEYAFQILLLRWSA